MITPIMIDQEWIDERAAILEFEAGMDRAQAERVAMEMWDVWSNYSVMLNSSSAEHD